MVILYHGALKFNDWCLHCKRDSCTEKDTDTEEEDGGRDWSDAATSQGIPGDTRSGKSQGKILSEFPKGHWSY